MPHKPAWPPEGMIAVGNYAFSPPHVPTELQVEEAEQFIFTNEAFVKLEENQRRRNVVRLAIAAASNHTLLKQEGDKHENLIPLIGGVVHMTVERHEGSPIFTYSLMQDQ